MGWLFPFCNTKHDLIRHLIRPQDNERGITWTTLAHRAIKDVLWTVTNVSTSDGPIETIIYCYLLAKQKGEGWGYKTLTEPDEPFVYSCPVSFFKHVPKVQSPRWRLKVQEHHDYHHAQLATLHHARTGDTIPLQDCNIPSIQLHSKHPPTGYYQGTLYRITADKILLDHPSPGRHYTESEILEQAALANGKYIRIAALSVAPHRVHVLFRGQDGIKGFYMSPSTYDAIPIMTLATIEDYASRESLEPAASDFDFNTHHRVPFSKERLCSTS